MKPHATINNDLTGEIIRLTCEVWGVTRADLLNKSHRRPLPWARAHMCHYLRRYAGHDTVSCGAILHISETSVIGYASRYATNLRVYALFVKNDQTLSEKVKALVAH